MHAAAGDMQRVKAQVQKRVQRAIGDHQDVTAATAITTRRSASGDEFLAPKRSDAVAAMTALDPNFYSINEHLKNKNARPAELTFGAGVALLKNSKTISLSKIRP
jgi:hypothetical protein